MRADPLLLGQCAEALDADPHSRDLAREARGLVLACGAALTAVLAVHRPGKDARGHGACRACGTRHCPTLRGISDALAAYALRPVATDQAEALRRAEADFGPATTALRLRDNGRAGSGWNRRSRSIGSSS
ncbi:hypothetical protein [Actinomadura sp. NBRC 104412]|uniref:hypothetical protein n=1 Tax=Actinomadura sp. NBRC 104412 TaxID=3032203 RepID=UPI002553811D|nr:hypothetical protein [Actinomadura sp. NBRC 104412]